MHDREGVRSLLQSAAKKVLQRNETCNSSKQAKQGQTELGCAVGSKSEPSEQGQASDMCGERDCRVCVCGPTLNPKFGTSKAVLDSPEIGKTQTTRNPKPNLLTHQKALSSVPLELQGRSPAQKSSFQCVVSQYLPFFPMSCLGCKMFDLVNARASNTEPLIA